MPNIFFISDTHFGHQNICKFTRKDGSALRPWDDVSEMDADMIKLWNNKVGKRDVVYHLGDVVINRKSLAILNELNGDKRLVLGNHDIFDTTDYLKYFKRVHGSHKIDNLWLTHIPVHIDSVPHWSTANVHGHIHYQDVDHPKYFNVSVERIEYSPVSLDELKKLISKKQENFAVA